MHRTLKLAKHEGGHPFTKALAISVGSLVFQSWVFDAARMWWPVCESILHDGRGRRPYSPYVVSPALICGRRLHFCDVNQVLVRVDVTVHSQVMSFVAL